MPHALELKYGLTAQELLDAIDKRFRLKVALEGAVAEVHFERKLRIAVKTIRNGQKPKVELQKTRAAKSDPSSRFYDRDHFDVVAVCVGRLTRDWSQFRYALVQELPGHRNHPDKLQVMHSIPDEVGEKKPRWFSRFQDIIDAYSV